MAGEAPAAAPAAPAPTAAPATTEAAEPETAETEGGAPAPAPAPDEPWRRAKHKVALDGKEDEVEYDELLKGYQRGKTATKRFEEAARQTKEVETLFEAMRSDKAVFWQVAKELGYNPQDLAAELMIADAEDEKLSPEAKELRSTKAELERIRAAEKQREEQAREAKLAQDAEREMITLKATITSTLKTSGVPATKHTIMRFVQIANGDPALASSESVAAAVREEYVEDMRELLASGNDALHILGEEGLKKLRASDQARVKSPFDAATAPAPPVGEQKGNGSQKRAAKGPISLEAFEDQLRGRR